MARTAEHILNEHDTGIGANSSTDDRAPHAENSVSSETTKKIGPNKVTHRSVRISTVLSGIGGLAVIAAIGILAWGWWSTSSDLHDQQAATADSTHAEQIATEYAVGASTIDYKDLDPWISSLKSNTTEQLSAKFDATAPQLKGVLVPLQWQSTATPISSVVTSKTDDIYKINVFLNVNTTNAQSPDSAPATVTYTVSVAKDADWKITDVGGMDGALPAK